MYQSANPRTVELAVHKKIIDYFHANPLSDKQTISKSVRPEYHIMTIEDIDYKELIPIVQQFLPFIKVIVPFELDLAIRENLKNYDKHDLSRYK